MSPTGAEIAFDDGASIFVANIDGSHVRRFTPEEGGGVSAPAWSPDGSKIVFSEANSAFILDIDTGRITRLVSERRPVWYPNFSGDGRTVLYTTVRHGALTLRTVSADGGPSTDVIRGAFGAYSPDGTTIAYRRTSFGGSDPTEMTSGSLWLADADGSHAHEIGRRAGWMSQIDPEALWPMWSPDGTKIAYQPTYKSAVRVIDIGLDRGSEIGDGIDPGWLNDHTLIIKDFQPANPPDAYFSLADIVSVDVRTGQPKRLSKDIRSIPGVRHLRASHDGTMIAFEDGDSIFVANIDGTHLPAVHAEAGCVGPELVAGWFEARVQRGEHRVHARHRHRPHEHPRARAWNDLVPELQPRWRHGPVHDGPTRRADLEDDPSDPEAGVLTSRAERSERIPRTGRRSCSARRSSTGSTSRR